MRRQVQIEVEYRVTPWQGVTGRREWDVTHVSAYRVWLAHDGFRWWQSHEWEYKGGNGERWAERWIPAPIRRWPETAQEPRTGEDPPPWKLK